MTRRTSDLSLWAADVVDLFGMVVAVGVVALVFWCMTPEGQAFVKGMVRQ